MSNCFPDPPPAAASPPQRRMLMKKIKVLVIDDSALIRALLTVIIDREPDMTVVGTAADPLVARDMIRERNPDVLTLDVEMPRMDGIEFLTRLMALRPMPVVMVSTLVERGAETTLRALELGAVDYVTKPKIDVQRGVENAAHEIIDKIRIAAVAKIRSAVAAPKLLPPVAAFANHRSAADKVIVVGASTGGTEAVKEFLQQMPADSPPVLVAQHMPAGFTQNFANRLNVLCPMTVQQAADGERVLPGHVYIAPGGRHLALDRHGGHFITRILDSDLVNRHRPSVEVLFRSAARHAGPKALGVMLTGMGRDGADAMLEMHQAGAFNIAQDEATCVVFGMPREAIAAGGVDLVLPLEEIAAAVLDQARRAEHPRFRASA